MCVIGRTPRVRLRGIDAADGEQLPVPDQMARVSDPCTRVVGNDPEPGKGWESQDPDFVVLFVPCSESAGVAAVHEDVVGAGVGGGGEGGGVGGADGAEADARGWDRAGGGLLVGGFGDGVEQGHGVHVAWLGAGDVDG